MKFWGGVGSLFVARRYPCGRSRRLEDRLLTKLTNVVRWLDELGFAPGQVERAAAALGYDIALEAALDWLCLNLTTAEFPALFTDGELKRDAGDVATAENEEHPGGGSDGEERRRRSERIQNCPPSCHNPLRGDRRKEEHAPSTSSSGPCSTGAARSRTGWPRHRPSILN